MVVEKGFGPRQLVFIGTEYKTLDSKGRLVIPSKFRKATGIEEGEGFIVVSGPNPYILLFTKQDWERVYEKVSRSSAQEGDVFDIRRTFFPSAEFLLLDKQGRLVLPPIMVAEAGLRQEIAVLGAGDHIEIWDRERWETYRKEKLKSQDQAAWRAYFG